MAGISEKALKSNYAENKYRFNGGNELQNHLVCLHCRGETIKMGGLHMNNLLFILAFIFAIVIFLVKFLNRSIKDRQKSKEINWLIQNGKVVVVSLANCSIKSGQNYDSRQVGIPSQIEMADGLFGKNREGSIVSEVSYIVYEMPEDGKNSRRFVSQPIFMPGELLRYKMDQNDSVKIYIDPKYPSRYFFDVRFLADTDS